MKTSVHVIVSAILAALLYPVFKRHVLFIFAGGVLIDIDHYFVYAYKYKNFSLFDCYYHYIKNMQDPAQKENLGILLIFHTTEFLFVMVVFSFYNAYALVFTIGLLVHYLLDLIYLYTVPKKFIVDHSLIHWICKNKLKVAEG